MNPPDSIGNTFWKDTLITNGGNLAINKNVEFDSENKTKNSYNLQSEKILTYSGIQGTHLIGEENYVLDVTGSSKPDEGDYIRCIYTSHDKTWLPAFCNIVETKVSLININSAQISQTGSLRMVGDEDIPAELAYHIAITPETNSGSSPAEGRVKTEFSGSIMEAGDNSPNISSTNQWKETSEVSGGIINLQKGYLYQSGLRF